MKSPANLLRLAFTSLLLFGGCVRKDTTIIYQKLIVRTYTTNGTTVFNGATFRQDDVFFTALIPYTTLASAFQWGSTAYASQPPEGYTKLAEQVADIKVITLNDFNDTYKAGSNLADDCTYYDTQSMYRADDTYMPYADSTARTKQATIDLINTSAVGGNRFINIVQRFAFRIKPKGYVNKPQRFAIILISDKYTALADTTVTLNFKP